MNTQEENVNPYAELADEDLNERIEELSNELRDLRREAKHRQTAMKLKRYPLFNQKRIGITHQTFGYLTE